MQSKASTISSGARAAAQTLNVPIERLEAQIHGNNKAAPHSPIPNNKEKSNRHHNNDDGFDNKHIEQNGKIHFQQDVYQHQHEQKMHHQQQQQHHHQQQQQQHHHSPHHNNKGVNNDGQDMGAILHQQDYDEQLSSLPASPMNPKYSLLQFAMQHFQDE